SILHSIATPLSAIRVTSSTDTARTKFPSSTSDKLPPDRFPKFLDYARHRQPLEHFTEEAEHDETLRDVARNSTAHDVEQLLLVELSDRRGVRAPHVVRLDLEVRQ